MAKSLLITLALTLAVLSGNGTVSRPSAALAAARQALTALPHSPELLRQLAGPGVTGPGVAGGAVAGGAVAGGAAAGSLGGIDVASHQHPVTTRYPKGAPINWRLVAAARYRYAFVKGTEGNYYINKWAAIDLPEAKAAGLDVAPYHFAIPNANGGAGQAQYAVLHSGYAPGPQTLPLTLDIEYDPYVAEDGTNECYGLSTSQMTAWIAAFVTTARALTGQYPIIYTTADWWDACTGGSLAFGSDPMWVAAYGFTTPPLPIGWANWTYWQYTSAGTVPGVDDPGATDLDAFRPAAVTLIDPGPLRSRPLSRISIPIGSLAGEPLTWSATGLPPGLRLSAAGVLTGVIMNPPANTAPATLTYHPTVTATNASGGAASVTFPWQIPAACPRHPVTAVCRGT